MYCNMLLHISRLINKSKDETLDKICLILADVAGVFISLILADVTGVFISLILADVAGVFISFFFTSTLPTSI